MPELTVRIPEELAQGLERYAHNSGQDVTDVTVDALEKFVAEHTTLSA
jgi:hypothetical protein